MRKRVTLKVPLKNPSLQSKRAVEITPRLLGDQFISINHTLIEIRLFRKKKVTANITNPYWKNVDIEAAWPSSTKLFCEAYEILCTLAEEFGVQPEELDTALGFHKAIDQFTRLVSATVLRIADVLGTGQYEEFQLKSIADEVLRLQIAANCLNKHVIKDFNFPKAPPSA